MSTSDERTGSNLEVAVVRFNAEGTAPLGGRALERLIARWLRGISRCPRDLPCGGDGPRKVAIITGASQGIGIGLVAGFRGAGYAVVGNSRSIGSVEEPDYVTVAGDIAEARTAHALVDRALERFGQVDSLINNAGIFIGKPFTDYTAEDYAAITGVNLAGFFHMTQAAIPHMVARGSGHVVNITTSIVDRASSERPSALVALTKGGLAAVTRSLAIEYASQGIRVNAVAPGIIRNPVYDDASYEGYAALEPVGRLGAIEDIVEAILYLERATFVTGEILHVDGGQAAGS